MGRYSMDVTVSGVGVPRVPQVQVFPADIDPSTVELEGPGLLQGACVPRRGRVVT